MQDLIDLVNLVQKTKFKSNGILEIIIEPETQMGQLYDALVSKRVLCDDDAKTVFPGYVKDPGRLAAVKYQLKERLGDSMFLLNFKESGYADRQKAFLECSKKWASAMIMIHKSARTVGINQLEQLLKHTIHFEFTELSIEILRLLRLHFGLCAGDEKKFKFYESQLHHCETLWLAESRIESIYMDMVVRFVNTKSGKSAIAENATYLESAQELLEKHDSFKIQLFGRLIQVTYYDSLNDFAKTEKACEEALAFFKQKPYQSGLSLELFYYNLIVCYLYSRQYAKGLEMIDAFCPLLTEGSYNWFKLKELHIYTYLHSGEYQTALDVFVTVVERPEFEHLSPAVWEFWKMMEAYFYFLACIDMVCGKAAEEIRMRFRMGRFINEVPTLSKDKRGMNVSILSIQLLCSALTQKLRNDLQDERVESLNKYRTRYLTDKENIRSNCFIGIIVQFIQFGHNIEMLRQKCRKFVEKLESTPWESINQNHEIEIIPYETLYKLVENHLNARRQTNANGLKIVPARAAELPIMAYS